ncbi:hypothetical protein CK516_11635 [Nostoc sp. 'Peltigera malacea cyanobiont' DB3992]|nr:hypothetical protein CK516_11635 [Nostoc sp. 'Peltigera malacea cyanobiont' DB3992]
MLLFTNFIGKKFVLNKCSVYRKEFGAFEPKIAGKGDPRNKMPRWIKDIVGMARLLSAKP